MKIAIIVHSQTGHTQKVAERLAHRLLSAGHSVHIEALQTIKPSSSNGKSVQLTDAPSLAEYQLVVFGAPVHGGQLSLVMQAYLKQLPSLAGKRVGGFVTEFFPFSGMGGDRSLRTMQEILLEKETHLEVGGVVNWMIAHSREKKIARTIEDIYALTK